MEAEISAAILTVSDSASRGEREDASGPALAVRLESLLGISAGERATVSDERSEINDRVSAWCQAGISLILVTGGTGVSPRDRTPEALRAILDFEIPGFPEKMRSATGANFAPAYLSRQVAGVRGRSLVLALPGSPRGAVECFEAVAPLIRHALQLIRGETRDHPGGNSPR